MRTYLFCIVFLGLACAALAGKRVACPEIFCFAACPHGYLTDKNGCSSCSCVPANQASSQTCQDWQCFVPCDNGYQMDTVTNCLTCTCTPASAIEPVGPGKTGGGKGEEPAAGFAPPMSGSSAGDSCNRMRCLIACDSGYELDSEGCPTCVCVGSSGSGDNMKEEGNKGLLSETGGENNNNNNNKNNNNDARSGAARNAVWLIKLLSALGLRWPF